MDAAQQPNYVEVRPADCYNRGKREEVATMDEALPLPVALRNDELTEKEFDTLYRNVTDPNSTKGRLKRVPRGIPVRDREPINS